MKRFVLAALAVWLLPVSTNAAVFRLGSQTDSTANTLNLTPGQAGSMWIWASTETGQTITGLSLDVTTSEPSVVTASAHTTLPDPQPDPPRWDGIGEGVLNNGNLLVDDTNAFVVPVFGDGTGLETGDANTFVLHSRIDITGSALGTTTLQLAEGAFEITDESGNAIPAGEITFGGGTVSVVPEPSSFSVIGLALIGVGRLRRRRR